MITDYLLSKIETDKFDDICFQRDGATCHTIRETMVLLRKLFGK